MAKKDKVLTENEFKKKYVNSGKADIILPSEKVIRLPSDILPLNHQLGGGIPYGKVMECFGWESTGKSLLAMRFGYAAQYLGGVLLWADMENAWGNAWADESGLDISAIELLDGDNCIEHFSDWAKDSIMMYRSRLTKNQPILLVCDSIAAGDTEANLDGDQSDKKAEMGNRAKAWDKMYRMRVPLFKKYGVCVIMINQLRGKIGASMFESAETTPGGKATGYYSSIRLGLVKGKQIKGKMVDGEFVDDFKMGIKCGQNVTFQVKKNKTFPPRDSVKSEAYFTDLKEGYVGFNRYMGLDTMALDKGIITKSGNTYSIRGKKIAGRKDDVLRAIAEKPKVRKYVISKLGINTISQTADQLGNISTNLFKV
jgi:recombination protein RecA